MLGRLLEISVSTSDPLEMLGYYQALGFREVTVGDVWDHPYAVVSDGDLCLGFHAYEFDSPSLSFVQPDLDHWVEAYRLQEIDLAFEKLSPDAFNEIGFVDPGGQMVAVLESRTFSPPPFDEHGVSRLGNLAAIELPCRGAAASVEFWARLGRSAESGRVAGTNLNLRVEKATSLTAHYHGDVLAVAEAAARHGLGEVSVSTDDRLATLRPDGGPVFVVSQSPEPG